MAQVVYIFDGKGTGGRMWLHWTDALLGSVYLDSTKVF